MEKKKLIGIFIVVPFLIALLFAGITRKCRKSGAHQRLEIVRSQPDLNAPNLQDGIVQKNGLIKKTIPVSPTFIKSHEVPGGSDFSADPFAEPPPPSGVTKTPNPRKILERIGITFGKGALVIYDEKALELTVVNTREQLELIEVYTHALDWYPPKIPLQLAIRAEIFEMPSLLALKVIESAAAHNTHSPERNALLKLLGRNKVRLVNAIAVIAQSGQRAKVEDTNDFPLPLSKNSSKDKKDKNGNKPDWEIRQIGTIFEVDPVLGADYFTINLIFSLEHHTAAPDLRRSKFPYPPTLHAKKIVTKITTQDGASILVGSWKPTGKPEYGKIDLMHLIFITANMQSPTTPVLADGEVGAEE